MASGSAAVNLRLDQRVSIQQLPYTSSKVFLYFNYEEFKDAVNRFCTGERNNPFNPSEELIQHIWEYTNGHPGATTAILEILKNYEVSIALNIRLNPN